MVDADASAGGADAATRARTGAGAGVSRADATLAFATGRSALVIGRREKRFLSLAAPFCPCKMRRDLRQAGRGVGCMDWPIMLLYII